MNDRVEAISVSRRVAGMVFVRCAAVLAGLLLSTASTLAAEQPGTPGNAGQSASSTPDIGTHCEPVTRGSTYIPVDSWVYPAVMRLYAMGYADDVYLGMRPWTRASVSHMLKVTSAEIQDADMYGDPTAGEAQNIYGALIHFLHYDAGMQCVTQQGGAHVESLYSVARAISGLPLRDSFHLGSTIINDYGRPYENGFNNYSGASGYAIAGRFTLYVRGEFQGAPSAAGYSQTLAQALSTIDSTTFLNAATGLPYNQTTIPMGPIATTTDGRFIEAYVSAHVLNHEISFGKQDDWLGPGVGGGMAYSNNAENIYSFRINRVEPLHIPLLSRITGPFRYDFLVGPLRGHTYMPNPANPGGSNPNLPNVVNPGDPWVHVEKVSFRPTDNLEFGFERTVIWGGEGHAPITIKSFLRSFFSLTSPTGLGVKNGRTDPGARFGAFDFSYRLPFLRNWLTLYSDAEAHDDVSPIDNPPRACYRPGLYLSHIPGIPKLDLRVEAVNTDSSTNESQGGRFQYWEGIQRQGYTNQGQLFGDWIGREDKGGQAWITYHLSGDEWFQVSVRNQKAAKDFIPGGTTLNDINFQAVKRIGKDFEINGNFALEHWKAPIYPTGTPTYPVGQQTVTTTTIQLAWFPGRKISF
jgi:hypothetical protein